MLQTGFNCDNRRGREHIGRLNELLRDDPVAFDHFNLRILRSDNIFQLLHQDSPRNQERETTARLYL